MPLPFLVLQVDVGGDDAVPVVHVHHVEVVVVPAEAVTLLLGHTRAAPCQIGATATTIHQEVEVEGQVQRPPNAPDLEMIGVQESGLDKEIEVICQGYRFAPDLVR